MPDVRFEDKAFEEYLEWANKDHKTWSKINGLIKDIKRNGVLKGIGKPEVLKHRKGYSRRSNDEDRLLYESDENRNLRITSCKGHYDD